jgi:hypothetical protein
MGKIGCYDVDAWAIDHRSEGSRYSGEGTAPSDFAHADSPCIAPLATLQR